MLCTETIDRLLNKTLNGVPSRTYHINDMHLLNIFLNQDYHAKQF